MQENTRFTRRLGAVGLRFCPEDTELLGYFLYEKIATMELPPIYDTLIRDCDLYGELEPWQIWEYYKGKDNSNKDDDHEEDEEDEEEEDMFFFTRLKKKSANGSRISRTVSCGGGAWQSEDTAKKVLPPPPPPSSSSTENALGFKKRFRYENKSNPEHDGDWIMFEYSLDPSLLESLDQPNDYVLCRIKKNNVNAVKKKKRKRGQEDHQDHQVKVNNIAEEDRQVYEEIDHGDSQSQFLGLMTTNFWNHDYNPRIFFF